MNHKYTIDKNVQILIAILKANNINKVVASPGTTNMNLVFSLQADDFFTMYSAPDERSAGYIALGLAAQTREIILLTCTGATASRNYLPAITEAYYRKLPILVVTGIIGNEYIGSLHPQVIDRTRPLKDTYILSVEAKKIKDDEDAYTVNLNINKAIIALKAHSMPVHIDLVCISNKDFSVQTLPPTRVIQYYNTADNLPIITEQKVFVFIGSHLPFSATLTKNIEAFCEKYGAIVVGDHTSNYKGKYFVLSSLATFQKYANRQSFNCDLLIHIGQVCGCYYTVGKLKPSKVWRVNEDGMVRDLFKTQVAQFAMSEDAFFAYYINNNGCSKNINHHTSINSFIDIVDIMPISRALPFSNIYMATRLCQALQKNSILHLGILNSLRSWNFVPIDPSISVYSNVGGFGIDGCMSTAFGAALADQSKIVYLVIGDLAFFYDINVLGNRFMPPNLRILLVNNGKGCEFTNYTHPMSIYNPETGDYVAAAGHYGNKSTYLVKNYVTNLGIDYNKASNKQEFDGLISWFTGSYNKPLLLEAFVNADDDSTALEMVSQISQPSLKDKTKDAIKGVIGKDAFNSIVKVVKGNK